MDKLYTERIAVSKSDKELFRVQCKELFLRDNKNYDPDIKLSDGFLFRRLVRYFLK